MERIKGDLDVSGMKSFQLPKTTILIKCPKCGDVLDLPLIDKIYYPDDGGHSVAFECEKCDIEIERKIDIISTVVTLDVHDPKII